MSEGLFNASAFSNASNYPGSDIIVVPWEVVFKDFCVTIEAKILLAFMLILTVFIFRMIILPRGKLGFFTDESFLLMPEGIKKLVSDIFYYGDSLLETLGLGCAIFIVYLSWQQGLINKGYTVWLWILGGFVIAAGLGELIYFIRNKKRLKSKDNKEIAAKEQEGYNAK